MPKTIKKTAKTTKTTKKTNGNGHATGSFDAQVASLLTGLNAVLANVKTLGLPVLTADERLHTNGKLRSGESAAITSVLDTVDANPALFASLAGGNAEAVDTTTARAALSNAASLAPALAVIESLHSLVSDGMIANGATAKDLSLPAYAIGKVVAKTNAKVRTSLAPAMTFYGTPARAHAGKVTRAVNKAKRSAKAAKASSATS